jgi:hypothetical protein
MLAKSKYRRNRGASLLEAPGMMMLIFLGFAFPLIGMCVFSYRVSLLYFAIRDAAYAAAKASTFTIAQAAANTAWTRDVAAWNGITSSGNPTLTIIITANPSGTTTTSSSVLGAVDPSRNIYFIQTTGTASLAPLLGSGWKLLFMNTSIPGLNAAYTTKMSQQVYIENPTGLTL